MSVVFHIAAQRDWERAMRVGSYAAASLDGDGFVHCSTAAQHAAVANARFAGRADLVLLLIDVARLAAEVRFEQAEAGGQAFPHVYGPVNLDAVFEATPYRPGADGRFHPHEEASGFAAHGAATLDQTARRAVQVMAGWPRRARRCRGGTARRSSLPSTRSGPDAAPEPPPPRRSSPPTPRCWGSCSSRATRIAGRSGVTARSPGRWTGSGRRPPTGSPTCARRSRCCSRPRHRGSRTSATSTGSSPTWAPPRGAGWRPPSTRPIPATPGVPGSEWDWRAQWRSTVADAPGVRAALHVDLAQQPIDVGEQAALDVPQLGGGPGVDEHQLGEDVAMGPGDLQRDVQGHRLPRGAGHVRGDELTERGHATAQLDQQPPERDQDLGFGLPPFLDALGEVGQVQADPTDLDRGVLQGRQRGTQAQGAFQDPSPPRVQPQAVLTPGKGGRCRAKRPVQLPRPTQPAVSLLA